MTSKSLSSISSSAAPGTGHHSKRGKANKPFFGAKLLLAAISVAVGGGPVVVSLMNAQQLRAQSPQTTSAPLPSFEVASVKRSPSGENTSFHITPNRLTVRNMVMEMIIEI